MKTHIEKIQCPRCGGTLTIEHGKSLLNCEYCDGLNLIVSDDDAASYSVREQIDVREASIRAKHELSSHSEIPSDLFYNGQFDEPELLFIPFYEITGLRSGIVVQKKIKRSSSARYKEPNPFQIESMLLSGINQSDTMSNLKTHHRRTDYDSRVILSDFHIARPAVSMHDLGIDQIQLVKRRREAEKFKIEPFQMREMQKRGTVLTPSQSVDEFSNIALRVYTQQGARQVELLDKDISIIYYPVWRIHYQYRKTSFQVLLDGITGERVYSRYPVNEERRLLAFLIGTGSLGLIAGSFIQLMMRLSWAEEYAQKLFVMGIYFWMFFAFIISAIAAFAWDQLRYPSEVVYRGSMREAVKIGKKSKSFFEKTVEKILKHIDLSIQSDSR